MYSCIPVQNTGSGVKYRYGYPYRYPALHVTYVILSVKHCIRSTEQSSVIVRSIHFIKPVS